VSVPGSVFGSGVDVRLVLPRVFGGAGRWVGCVVRLVYTAPPTPTRSPGITLTRVSSVPGAAFASLALGRRFRAGLRPSGSRCRLQS
jgi:hypothetical protein